MAFDLWSQVADLFGEHHTNNNGVVTHSGVGHQIGTALQNWWYSNTGQNHLTSEYQHEEELANTAYQRAAKDMAAAGLSKFGGVSTAGSPSPNSGSSLLATAMAAQQLKGQRLANQENKYNLSKAKEWGVPTSAVGDFAKYDAICKLLLGKGVHDIVDEEGLFGMLKKWFGFGDPDDPSPNTTAGVATDAVQAVENSVPASLLEPVYQDPLHLFAASNVMKPAPFQLPKYIALEPKNRGSMKVNPEALNFKVFGPEDYKEPSMQGAAVAAVNSVNRTTLQKDVDKWMRQTLNDRNMDSAHIESLARTLSKLYDKPYDSVLNECYNWVEENLSNVEWIYYFD